jgi:hypothetical protein
MLNNMGMGSIFSLFPVKINYFGVSFGRDSNPATASCAAAYTLIVFTARSFSNVEIGIERGLL